MPKKDNQLEHDEMVRSVAHYVRQQGHTDIRVNLFGYDIPDQIYWDKTPTGHTPDITSASIRHFIIDVETSDSLNDPDTEDKWKLFSAHARQQSNSFIIAVPRGFDKTARDKVAMLGIRVDNVWEVD